MSTATLAACAAAASNKMMKNSSFTTGHLHLQPLLMRRRFWILSRRLRRQQPTVTATPPGPPDPQSQVRPRGPQRPLRAGRAARALTSGRCANKLRTQQPRQSSLCPRSFPTAMAAERTKATAQPETRAPIHRSNASNTMFSKGRRPLHAQLQALGRLANRKRRSRFPRVTSTARWTAARARARVRMRARLCHCWLFLQPSAPPLLRHSRARWPRRKRLLLVAIASRTRPRRRSQPRLCGLLARRLDRPISVPGRRLRMHLRRRRLVPAPLPPLPSVRSLSLRRVLVFRLRSLPKMHSRLRFLCRLPRPLSPISPSRRRRAFSRASAATEIWFTTQR